MTKYRQKYGNESVLMIAILNEKLTSDSLELLVKYGADINWGYPTRNIMRQALISRGHDKGFIKTILRLGFDFTKLDSKYVKLITEEIKQVRMDPFWCIVKIHNQKKKVARPFGRLPTCVIREILKYD